MTVSAGIDLLQWTNQRWVCVSSGVLVCCAPCDPGVCVFSPLCLSASCAGYSDGAMLCRLCGQKPLHLMNQLGTGFGPFWSVGPTLCSLWRLFFAVSLFHPWV